MPTDTKPGTGKVKVTQSLKAAREHLEALGRDLMRPICIRVIAETDAAKAFVAKPENHPMRFRYRGTMNELFDKLKRRNDDGFAIYCVLNRTDGKGTKLANFTHATGVPLDLDDSPLPKKWRGGIRPHLIIESSPGKFQCVFNIVPTTDLKAAKEIAQQLAATYGGDPKVCDTPRVLRLAGFKHQKGKPFISRIVDSNPFDDPYTLAQLGQVLDKLPPPKPRAEGPSGAGKMDRTGAEKLLDDLDPAIVVPTNAEWIDFAMGAKVACADSDAEDYVLGWFARDGGHDADEAEARWNTFTDREDGIGVGTFIKFLQDHGVDGGAIQSVFGDKVEAADDFDDDTPFDDWTPEGDKALTTIDSEPGLSPIDRKGLKVDPKSNVAPDTYGNALTAVANSGLTPAWNVLKMHVEFRGTPQWDARYGFVLTDHLARLIRLYLMERHQGVAYEPRIEHLREALLTVAYGNLFNPVAEYLDSLKWDATPRVEKLFGKYFSCDVDAYTRGVSKAFMVGAVRRVRKPGCKFDTMPVLKGPQGWNKSTGLKTMFGAEYFSDADLGKDLSNKDVGMKIRGTWCHEFAEIDSLSHHQVGVLKAFLSRATDRQRDPYGVFMQDTPRNGVFAATVNEGGYLKDQTGARRFWPLQLRERINVELIAADRDQLWAEAAFMEARGDSLELAEELWPEAAKRQRGETTIDPWEDTLAVFLQERAANAAARDKAIADGLDPDGDDDDGAAFSERPARRVLTSELYSAIGVADAAQTKGLSQRVRTVMESLGWTYREGVRVGDKTSTGYMLKKTGEA